MKSKKGGNEMNQIGRHRLEYLRKYYPKGTRVELVDMEDKYAPPIGTRGTVTWVDDTGSLLVNWDNGSTLSVLYDKDEVKKL